MTEARQSQVKIIIMIIIKNKTQTITRYQQSQCLTNKYLCRIGHVPGQQVLLSSEMSGAEIIITGACIFNDVEKPGYQSRSIYNLGPNDTMPNLFKKRKRTKWSR